MPGVPSWLSDISRRKLRVAACGDDGLRDTINLHRFVLLKNSITQAQPDSTQSLTTKQASSTVPEDALCTILACPTLTSNSKYADSSPSSSDSEEKWLQSVLDTLDDEFDEVEVEVRPVEEDDDLDFSDLALHTLYDSWSPDDVPSPNSSTLLSSPSILPSQPFTQTPPLQDPFDPVDSQFDETFVQPRYPEADYDLPISDQSSDSDSDDEGPLTPYSGSRRSIDEQGVTEPEVYVQQDSYFLYPSELDLISPQPIYYQQQC